ncbi:ATPase domain-containing protein [Methanothermobacter sp.]|uniref:RAD55 family ATPase n=1 Tax=Methanothermobacter sp. TaxID=1884223 RepID=UPI00260FE96B|nr:ATPase domain-containing protein [Methanothermobacter sp.]MDI9615639.1 ATPase domain-containing protein [Methanothermobacter sp.]
MGYSLGINGAELNVPPGSNLLVMGDIFSGKDVLARSFIRDGLENSEICVMVTLNDTADKLMDELKCDKDNLYIVDCISSRFGPVTPSSDNVFFIDNPMNLAHIMVMVEDLIDNGKEGGVRVVIDSVSTLLMYSHLKIVFKFLHMLTAKIRSAGAVSLMLIEDNVHDDMEVRTLQPLYNGIVHLSDNMLKIQGFTRLEGPYRISDDSLIFNLR